MNNVFDFNKAKAKRDRPELSHELEHKLEQQFVSAWHKRVNTHGVSKNSRSQNGDEWIEQYLENKNITTNDNVNKVISLEQAKEVKLKAARIALFYQTIAKKIGISKEEAIKVMAAGGIYSQADFERMAGNVSDINQLFD